MVATTPSAARPRPRAAARPAAKPKSQSKSAKRPKRIRPGLQTLWGLVWAGLLFGAAEAGPVAVAALMMVVAGLAGASGVRAAGGLSISMPAQAGPALAAVPPFLGLAVAGAVLVPAAALGGLIAALIMGALMVAAGVALIVTRPGAPIPYRTLVAVIAPTLAAASTVLAAKQGLTEVTTLLAAICLFDAANFLTGQGRTGWPIGSICGALTVAVFSFMVAAVVVPPFSGHRPWILLGLVAVLAPAGVVVSGLVSAKHRIPALRRLDSLVLAAPVWVIGVALLLHR
jgi:hypothetical protein